MPVAYQVLAEGVCVYAADGTQVGTVHHVIAAVDQDIFHGLVIATVGHGRRFVEAADVASLHERGVDLRIDVEAVAALAEPGGAAPEYSEDPSQTKWAHWARRLSGRSDWQRRR
jgi:uncharacterized protein YrrD